MKGIKLSRLPDRVPTKLTISVSPRLHKALELYAKLYCETYGEDETPAVLIPYMLQNFLDGDREFSSVFRSTCLDEDILQDGKTETRRRRTPNAAARHISINGA